MTLAEATPEPTHDRPLEIPPVPVPPTNMLSLEHVMVYEKELAAWKEAVDALLDAEWKRVNHRRHMLDYRREHWAGW